MNQKDVSGDIEAPEQEQGIGRHMGLLSGTFLITGFVIGSGVFAAPGQVVGYAGSVGLSLLLWLAGGAITTCAALAYAELGTLFPKNGADQVYLSEAFHPVLGLAFSMSNVLLACTFVEAAMASIFGEYLYKIIKWDSEKGPTEQPKISEDDWMPRIIGIVSISVVATANMLHKKAGTSIQNVFTVGKLAALVMIIVIGFVYLGKVDQGGFQTGEDAFAGTETNAEKIVNGLIFAIFGYTGFNNLNTAAGELKNPSRNLPLSIILSMLITSTLYVLANLAYFAVLGGPAVAESDAVALLVGSRAMGMAGVYILAVGVILSTVGSQNGGAICHSRLIMAAADEGIWMPRIMGKISSRGTPIYAFIMNMVLTNVILVAFKDFSILGPVTCFILLTYYGLSNAACIWLRFKRPDAERAFKVPLIFPATFTVVAAAINILSLVWCDKPLKGIGYAAALAFTFVIPAIVYYFRVERPKRNAAQAAPGYVKKNLHSTQC